MKNRGLALPESVRSVKKMSLLSPPYYCHFCPGYSTQNESDMDLHKLEKHNRELLDFAKLGWLNIREQKLVEEIKMTMKVTLEL